MRFDVISFVKLFEKKITELNKEEILVSSDEHRFTHHCKNKIMNYNKTSNCKNRCLIWMGSRSKLKIERYLFSITGGKSMKFL